MLKTLEEPPEHVKFVLATTDPQKIPVTVLSRCLQFNLKQLPPAVVGGQLEHVLTEEKIAFEPAAVRLLARAAAGSMRDGLSLLDQAIAHGAGSVAETAVREMIGAVDAEFVVALLEAIGDSDVERVFAECGRLAERNLSFDTALADLAVALHDIALLQIAPGAVAADLPARDRLAALAQKMDPEIVQLDYQIAVQGRTDLPLAPDEYAGFTMTLLRMLAFAPDAGSGEVRRAEPLRAKPPARTVSVGTTAAGSASVRPVSTQPGAARNGSPVESARPAPPPNSASVPARSASTASAVNASPSDVFGPDASAASSDSPVDDWPQWIAQCRLSGMALQLAHNAELRAHRRTAAAIELDLVLDESNRHLAETGYRDKLSEALSAALGARVRLKVDIGDVRETSIAAQDKRAREKLQEQAAATFTADPFVRDAMRLFDARIRPQTIQPIPSGTNGVTEQGPKP
jgi:DNA polymerase-3 subunit gamma/tau